MLLALCCYSAKSLWIYTHSDPSSNFYACIVLFDHILSIHRLIWHAHSWVSQLVSLFSFPPASSFPLELYANPRFATNNKQELWFVQGVTSEKRHVRRILLQSHDVTRERQCCVVRICSLWGIFRGWLAYVKRGGGGGGGGGKALPVLPLATLIKTGYR